MKPVSVLSIASLAGTAIAFSTPASNGGRLNSTPLPATKNADVEEERTIVFSTALPFMERPKFLDGSMAGDVGFDPLNFARGPGELRSMREAELKHSRLAMLAAAGWPLSEVLDRKIAAVFNMEPLLDNGDRVPSLLNGGLGKVSPLYWLACLTFAAVIDFNGTNRATFEAEGYFPGNLGFDPLGLYPKNEDEQKVMQTAELKHGRVAMMAVVGYAVQEFVYKSAVVDETPFFFTPFWN